MTEQILFIASSASPSSPLCDALLGEGYQVDRIDSRQIGLILEGLQRPADLVVVVADTQPESSLELCRSIRALVSGTPCLMVEAPPGSVAAALRCGADDCVASMADPVEIVARVEALLRRARLGRPGVLAFGDVQVDTVRRRAMTPRGSVDLAPKELSLLVYLTARAGAIVAREELLGQVWGYSTASTRTVDTHMATLRHKLETDSRRPAHLLTVRGRGYQFLF